MILDDQYIPIGDLKAETWLNVCFPGEIPEQVVTNGIFYSNYCEDLLEVETMEGRAHRIKLSRDGLFHLLPEALFFNDNRLQDPKLKAMPVKAEKERVMTFFEPFDLAYFQVGLGLDQTTSQLEACTVNSLVKEIYDVDVQSIQNPFVRQMAPFLLQASTIRGDFPLIGKLMASIIGFHTEIKPVVRKLEQPDEPQKEMCVARVLFYIPDLSNSEYARRYEELGEFVNFVADWFFPFNQAFEYAIKDNTHPFVLDGTMTLDYNTYL